MAPRNFPTDANVSMRSYFISDNNNEIHNQLILHLLPQNKLL